MAEESTDSTTEGEEVSVWTNRSPADLAHEVNAIAGGIVDMGADDDAATLRFAARHIADGLGRPSTAGNDFTEWVNEEATIEELRVDVLHLASAHRKHGEICEDRNTWRELARITGNLIDNIVARSKAREVSDEQPDFWAVEWHMGLGVILPSVKEAIGDGCRTFFRIREGDIPELEGLLRNAAGPDAQGDDTDPDAKTKGPLT